MPAKNVAAKTWTLVTSADGKRWSNYPAGDKPAGPFANLVPWEVWDGVVPAVPPSSTGATYYVSSGVSDHRGTTNGAPVGSNSNNGTSPSTPFLTIAKAKSMVNVANGDTVLIRGGYYHEGIDLDGWLAAAAKPVTFGSYGDGEVILDGSQDGGSFVVTDASWVQQNGSVYRANIPTGWDPVAIVVGGVPLFQIPQTNNGNVFRVAGYAQTPSTSTITPGSGKWGWDDTGRYIWADFGSGGPTTSDWFIVGNTGNQHHVYAQNCSYITFDGLTIRGGSNAAFWSYRTGAAGTRNGANDHITFRRCDIKCQGKAGIAFGYDTNYWVDRCRVYHNVLSNWPRGNNGNAEAGGGWPGALNGANCLGGKVTGCVVYMNGGEGVISYGSETGYTSGSVLFEHNIIFDNWSVNTYIDNQPNDTIRGNLIFRTDWSIREADCLLSSSAAGYPWDDMQKYTANVMIADEFNSSSPTGQSNNTDAKVYNNIVVGGRFGIRNYGESCPGHGYRSCLIANNLIMMPANEFNQEARGFFFQKPAADQTNNNTGSTIANNIVVGYAIDPDTSHANSQSTYTFTLSEWDGAVLAGADNNQYHMYSQQTTSMFATGFDASRTTRTLAGWATLTGMDESSVLSDPGIANPAALRGAGPYPYTAALLSSAGAGVDLSAYFTDDFSGNTRSTWKKGPFA